MFLPQYRIVRDQRLMNGSIRQYTLLNSGATPVEEFSDYTIYITAVSTSGRRSLQSSSTTTTLQSGIMLCIKQ